MTREFNLGLKHVGSCLKDLMAVVVVDEEARLVTLRVKHFDSSIIASMVLDALYRDHGIQAFRDDSLGWVTPPADYRLRIDIGGHLFDAQVVKLAVGNQVAVSLHPLSGEE